MIAITTLTVGFGRRFALGLACCALAACAPSTETGTPSGSGGSNPGTGGAGTGGATGTGGRTGSGGAATSSGGASVGTGGAAVGTGGAANGGSQAGGATATGGRAAGGAAGGGSGTCNGAALCDSFERAALGPDWTLDNSVPANVVEIVTTRAHTGTSSVHMMFGTARTATFIDETIGFPATNNSYWGRVWLFVMTGLEPNHHVYIEGSTGVDPPNIGVRALNTQGNGLIATNIAPPDTGGTSTVPMPQGVWTCFEWQVIATAGTGGVHLFMNGTEVPGTVALNRPIPNLIKQRIGYERYAAGTAGELWIDDYAIGTARITCN
jgi:hypothetical protein